MAKSKKPSRTLAIVGVIALALVAGFGGSYIASAINGGGGGAASAVATPGSWIKEIQKRGELRAACADSPPTSVVSDDGTCDGPVMLPFKELADALEVKYVPVAATYQNIIAGLQAGKYDIAANLDETTARTLAIRFTADSYVYEGVFLMPRDNASKYTSADSIFNGSAPIATGQGTSYDQALQLHDLKAQPVLLPTYQEATQAVKAGRADTAFFDVMTAGAYAQDDPSLCILVPEPAVHTMAVTTGVSPNIDEFSLQTVNFAINDSIRQGRFGAAWDESGALSADNIGDLAC